jgi:hypothetical protein
MAAVFNQWHRQSYVMQGQAFPDPRDAHLQVQPAHLTWRWWDQANEVGAAGLVHIQVARAATASITR